MIFHLINFITFSLIKYRIIKIYFKLLLNFLEKRLLKFLKLIFVFLNISKIN